MESFVGKMENHEIDIVVGTQMIAKGLDFPKLTLVGVVLADVALSVPDFRAAERAFQLLTQVSGRAGRHYQGQVIIQTYRQDHPSLIFSQHHDVRGFVTQELIHRKELFYPPYSKIACVRFSSLKQSSCHQYALDISHALRSYIDQEHFENRKYWDPHQHRS